MLPLFTALLFTLAAQTSPVACAPDNLAACTSTNDLIWSPAFRKALRDFVGDGRASWLYADGEIIDQVIAVLGGPDEKPVHFAPGLIRFSACRAHSCDEKGSAILTSGGQIKALGILHFACSRSCSHDYRLTILERDEDDRVKRELIGWARTVVQEYNQSSLVKRYGASFRVRLAQIEVVNTEDRSVDRP